MEEAVNEIQDSERRFAALLNHVREYASRRRLEASFKNIQLGIETAARCEDDIM